MGGSVKVERLQARIQEILGTIISERLLDPRLELVTVTQVKLTPDLHFAKVYVSASARDDREAEERTVLRALDHARGRIEGILGKRLRTRVVPRLEFAYDRSLKKSFRVQQLLKEIAEERGETYDPVPDYVVEEPEEDPPPTSPLPTDVP